MTTATDVIAALNQRRQRKSLRPEAPGQFPSGWQDWFDAMPRVDAHAPGAAVASLVDAAAAKPLRAIPRSPRRLNRWQAFGVLWQQNWEPDLREDRNLRIGVRVLDMVLHLLLAGALLWSSDPLRHELLAKLGPEPLTAAFDGERLFQQSRGRSMAVKPFIMDNAVVVGVGNIYATEALFAAGIDPRREAGSISRASYVKLAEEIKRILAHAIERGGTTLRDFIGGDGQPGYFQQELFAYGRGGEFCKVCGTTLREVKLGQRASVYCPKCQR